MATEHLVDLASGTAVDQDIEGERCSPVSAQQRAAMQRRSDAVARLRSAAIQDPAIRDVLIVLGLDG